MNDSGNGNDKERDRGEINSFVRKRMVLGILLALVILWVAGALMGLFQDAPLGNLARTITTKNQEPPASTPPVVKSDAPETVAHETTLETHAAPVVTSHSTSEKSSEVAKTASGGHEEPAEKVAPPPPAGTDTNTALSESDHSSTPSKADALPAAGHTGSTTEDQHAALPAADDSSSGTPKAHALSATLQLAKGMKFVTAAIEPMRYELTERFYGWRPNDIMDFTDNVNNFQLGVLEVTRRTVVSLTERISRTGSTASFDKNLENAMNWFMIKADRYWFPSPESKYKAGLDELNAYREKLAIGEAPFHTRTDNLIPLLSAYEDLLGSCDENLVKHKEKDGTQVSFFSADDYFFYAQGVASAMHTVLEAVYEDFHTTIDTRRGIEVLHHAIDSCRLAMEIDPFIITDSSLDGLLANHRANMAARISHARFYIGVLIKALST
jgi:hypothetical protein